MNHIVNVWVLLKHFVQLLLVGDVQRVVLGPLAADELDAVQDLLGGVVEVVDDDDLIVSLEKGKSGEGADVAGATGEKSVLELDNRFVDRVRHCRGLSHSSRTTPLGKEEEGLGFRRRMVCSSLPGDKNRTDDHCARDICIS